MTDKMNISSIDALDRKLIAMLREDARQPVTSLAHGLSLSRASVYARIARLERNGIIQGYTVRIGSDYDRQLIRAHIMVKVAPKLAREVERQLGLIHELLTLHAISGEYDMIATVEAEGVAALNDVIDRIGDLDGVTDTTSSILLATKLIRGLGHAI